MKVDLGKVVFDDWLIEEYRVPSQPYSSGSVGTRVHQIVVAEVPKGYIGISVTFDDHDGYSSYFQKEGYFTNGNLLVNMYRTETYGYEGSKTGYEFTVRALYRKI